MKLLIIFLALIAVCLAVPAFDREDATSAKIGLLRPSPIHPDIVGEPKPASKFIGLTDTTNKHGIDTKPSYHHRSKRDQKQAPVNVKKSESHKPTEAKKLQPAVAPKKPVTPVKLHNKPKNDLPIVKPVSPAKHRSKRDVPEASAAQPVVESVTSSVSQIYIDQELHKHKHEEKLHQSGEKNNQSNESNSSESDEDENSSEAAVTPINNIKDVLKHKIHVPLVAKLPHTEVSQKEEHILNVENSKPIETIVAAGTENKPSEVQIEDLSENAVSTLRPIKIPANASNPYLQHLLHHSPDQVRPLESHVQAQAEKTHVTAAEKEEAHIETSSVASTTISNNSSEPEFLRKRPVPVAELFSRPKQTEN